jgi:hypothetical protein
MDTVPDAFSALDPLPDLGRGDSDFFHDDGSGI